MEQWNVAAHSTRGVQVGTTQGSSGDDISTLWPHLVTAARPPPELDKSKVSFKVPLLGQGPSCHYQSHATTSGACVLRPDAPYSISQESAKFSPAESLDLLTALGSEGRLAATHGARSVPRSRV